MWDTYKSIPPKRLVTWIKIQPFPSPRVYDIHVHYFIRHRNPPDSEYNKRKDYPSIKNNGTLPALPKELGRFCFPILILISISLLGFYFLTGYNSVKSTCAKPYTLNIITSSDSEEPVLCGDACSSPSLLGAGVFSDAFSITNTDRAYQNPPETLEDLKFI